MEQFDVRFLPDQTEIPVEGDCVIMTDVLRASSTMVTALANGARCIFPQAEIPGSLDVARHLKNASHEVILGGERNGVIVDGFDLGNSPLEYSKANVEGKSIVLCTSNGTWALEFCRGADEIFIGALINLNAITQVAAKHRRAVVVCAGTNRQPTGEDILFAGGVAAGLVQQFPKLKLNSLALQAHSIWRDMDRYNPNGLGIVGTSAVGSHMGGSNPQQKGPPQFSTPRVEHTIYEFFLTTRGGSNLKRLDYVADLKYCSQLSTHTNTPRLDQETWEIR